MVTAALMTASTGGGGGVGGVNNLHRRLLHPHHNNTPQPWKPERLKPPCWRVLIQQEAFTKSPVEDLFKKKKRSKSK